MHSCRLRIECARKLIDGNIEPSRGQSLRIVTAVKPDVILLPVEATSFGGIDDAQVFHCGSEGGIQGYL